MVRGTKPALLACALFFVAGSPAYAATATQYWTGNGTTLVDGVRTLNTQSCGGDSQPHLLWILSGTKASTARIHLSDGWHDMDKPGIDKKTGISTFKFLWQPESAIDLDGLYTASVYATYNDAKNKATLTIGDGCLGGASGPCASDPLASASGLYANPVSNPNRWGLADFPAYFLKPYATVATTLTNFYPDDNAAIAQAITDSCLTVSYYYRSGGAPGVWTLWPTGASYDGTSKGNWVYQDATTGRPSISNAGTALDTDSFRVVFVWDTGSATHTYEFFNPTAP